jgi:cytochrome c-type biogenesis protein
VDYRTVPEPGQGDIGGFILGTMLGLVWTPCAGPVLGSILTIVATSKDTAWASLLLVVHAIGAAVPMLAIAHGGQAVTTRVRRVARISPRLQQGFGVVVILFAIASYFQYDTLIVARLTGFYPDGQIGLSTSATAKANTIRWSAPSNGF